MVTSLAPSLVIQGCRPIVQEEHPYGETEKKAAMVVSMMLVTKAAWEKVMVTHAEVGKSKVLSEDSVMCNTRPRGISVVHAS